MVADLGDLDAGEERLAMMEARVGETREAFMDAARATVPCGRHETRRR